VTGAVKTFCRSEGPTGGADVPNGVSTDVRTTPPDSPRLVNQTFSFDCRRFLASSVMDERAAMSCTPPLEPNTENVAATAPGMSRIERRTSRAAVSSLSPMNSGAGSTMMRPAIVRASMTRVARRGTYARTSFR
jgi:hypothetical protein